MKKGVTLLLAIMISSIAIAIGLGIALIVLGELNLSGTAKESYQAFYAADTGTECALYWDLKEPTLFDPVTCSGGCNIECGGVSNAVTFDGSENFGFQINNDVLNLCSRINVRKWTAVGPEINTTVTSFGENKQCSAPSSEKTVQRGLEVSY